MTGEATSLDNVFSSLNLSERLEIATPASATPVPAMSSLQRVEDVEDEIILQHALLESLDDDPAGSKEQRQAIIDTINVLEQRLEFLDRSSSTSTAPPDDSPATHAASSRTSVTSDDEASLPSNPMLPATSAHPILRPSKRPADDSAVTSAAKRIATGPLKTGASPASSQAALRRTERYRQAEAAAHERYKAQLRDAEFAAQLSRQENDDTPQPGPVQPAQSIRPHPSMSYHTPAHLQPRPRSNPAVIASASPGMPSSSRQPSQQTSNLHDRPRPIDRPIDRPVDRPVDQPSQNNHLHRRQPLPWAQDPSAAHASLPPIEIKQALANLVSATREVQAAQSNHRAATATRKPPEEVRRLQDLLDKAMRLYRDAVAIHSDLAQKERARAVTARPSPYSQAPYTAANIYEPIKKAIGQAGKTVARWGSDLSQLGQLVSGPSNGYGDDEDYYSSDGPGRYPDHYGRYSGVVGQANAEPAISSEEEAKALADLIDNIRADDEQALKAEEVELESMTVTLKPYQGLGLTWLQNQEDGSNKGSILADDMGLGKTVQAIALMATRKSQDPLCKTTLVIAPVALLHQWHQEIKDKLKRGRHAMNVFVHHGTQKMKRLEDLRRFDVVLTTYGTLASEQRKYDRFHERKAQDRQAVMTEDEKGFFTHENAHWFRVVLDEAQNIKNKNTRTAKAVYRLRAQRRLCMTGTPMMNNVDELFSLLHFLRIQPYCHYHKFQMTFSKPLKSPSAEYRQEAMRTLQALLKATLLRRHKKTEIGGRRILVLPERVVEHSAPEFSAEERDFYNGVEINSQIQFNKYVKKGTVGRSYASILVLLLRLRQACCHPHLIKDFGAVAAAANITEDTMIELAQKLSEAVIGRIKEREGAFECPVCFDATDNPAIFVPCGHDTCSDCFAKIAETANADDGIRDAKCPNCRSPINTKKVIDYETFKKVHEPGKGKESVDPAEAETESEAEDSDIDTDDSEDADDDADSLADFIANDSDEEKDTKSEAETTSELETSSIKGKGKGKAIADHPYMVQASAAERKKKKKKSGKGKMKQKKQPKTTQTLAELKKLSTKNKKAKKRYLKMIRQGWTTSAKIQAAVDMLKDIIEHTDEKVIVFSQWTSLLDLVEVPVDDAGWGYERYDGSMNAKSRAEAVDRFKDQRSIRLMLISLKAGNAGLNLNIASRVIILDPFWNPFIEEQAIDRAHRLGQTREVKVSRLLIADTVEDRILALQDKKREMIGEALDEGAGQRLSRLTPQELGYLFGVRRLNE